MNQSKFSLADLITLLAAFAFGFICFLGANFYTLGDTKQSIVLAVIISVSLSITALGAKWLKRTKSNFKTCFIFEIVLLVFFTTLTAYFTYSPFSHYFVVSEQKTKIQSDLNASITQAKNMFSEYKSYANDRETQYETKLKSVVKTKTVDQNTYDAFGFLKNGVSNQQQIEDKMFMMHSDLFPSNFDNMKKDAIDWLDHSKGSVNNWRPIGVVDVVKNVEQNSKDWLKELVQLSEIQEFREEREKFEYPMPISNVKKYFTSLGKPTALSVGLAFVTYLLMLYSWFITKRDRKRMGAIQSYEVIL